MPRAASRARFALALAFAAASVAGAPPADQPTWIAAFGYDESAVHPIDIGELGVPYVEVRIGGRATSLLFDTGNMVGLSVSTALFEQLGLRTESRYDRLSSSGETIATLRIAQVPDVWNLGRNLGPLRVYELEDRRLSGLAGPILLAGGHFTLDYGSRRIGVGSEPLPDSIPGFFPLPLVRSRRHPRLILVRGTIEGRRVLIELDTGKSRTVVNPILAAELGLRRGGRGVAIDELGIGELSFSVASAKEVDQGAIDRSLPEEILAGIGSDLLSRFVWTVDYEADLLWLPARR